VPIPTEGDSVDASIVVGEIGQLDLTVPARRGELTRWCARMAGTTRIHCLLAVLRPQLAHDHAWSRFVVARLWLAARGRTALRLMAFLDDAHRRSILRRVGPTYEFRHARLRERLAAPAMPEEHQERPV
jgi:hypothetical protein